MLKKIILFVMILLMIPLVSANFNYTELGNYNALYEQGLSKFNSVLSADVSTSRNLADGKFAPLVNDLDGDGIVEVIAIDGNTIKIWRGSSLATNNSISIPNASGSYSNMLTFDIDGDGYIEIILGDSSTNEDIFIFEFNETSFYLQKHLEVNSSEHTGGEFLIKCGAVNDCLVAYPHIITSGAGATNVYARYFNATGIQANQTLIHATPNAMVACFPKIPNMQYINHDSTGENEYVFSFLQAGGGSLDEKVIIEYIQTANGMAREDDELQITTSDFIQTGVGTSCGWDLGRYVTSPLVMDFEIGGSFETLIAYNTELDEFKLDAYDAFQNRIGSAPYPQVQTGEGELLSNLIKMNAFDTPLGSVDVCVLGFSDSTDKIDLLCASDESSGVQTREHIIQFGTGSNLNSSYNRRDNLIHSIEATGDSHDEVITTIGTLQLDWNIGCLVVDGCLDRIWANPIENGTVVSVDADKVGWEDLVMVTTSDIWYVQDGFAFSGAVIGNYTIDPCTEGTWKVSNASGDGITREVDLSVPVSDADGDQVMAKMVLYENSINNQSSGWHGLSASGATFRDRYIINVTDLTAELVFYANDTSNPTEIDTESFTIAIATSGVEEGDCVTRKSFIQPDLNLVLEFQANNTIENSLNDLKDSVGLNLTNAVIWLIIMVVVGGIIAIAGFKNNADATMVLATVGVMEFIMMILGISLGYVQVIWLWLMIVIACAILAFGIRQKVTGA